MLPIAPFTETSGSFVNAEARLQSFHGVVQPFGGYPPGCAVEGGLVKPTDAPGFGLEEKRELSPALRQLLA